MISSTVGPQTWMVTPQIWTVPSQTWTWIWYGTEESMIREISLSDLLETVKADWADIKREVEELLKNYEISPKYAELLIKLIKEIVEEKLKGVPSEVLEAMTKLYIKLTCVLLKKGRDCIE